MFARCLVLSAVLLSAGHAMADSDAAVTAALGLRESAVPVRDMPNWKKPQKIVVLVDSAARLAWFQEAAKGTTVVGARNPAEFKAALADADALIGTCRADVVAAGPKLRWVQTQGAGVEDCIPIPRVQSGAVLLTNMQRLNGSNVAEHALAMMLALSRNIPDAVDAQHKQEWKPSKPGDLAGKTVLIVGLGGIGTEIAKRAHAFDMNIIATRNSGRGGPDFVAPIGAPGDLPELIAQADFVVNVTPLTPETTGLFNAAMFARMKSTAFFFNLGRGKSVVTDDLVAALNKRTIAGAGLDVVDPEPLPKSHPLWSAHNVLITPHAADQSDLKTERMWSVMRENLRRYVAGDKMLSVVDVKRGY